MISARSLTSALTARKVAAWCVVERAEELAVVDEARPSLRTEERRRWIVTVHHDAPAGRGTARVEVGALDGDAREIIDQALLLASAAIGRPWRTPPPAAPARVDLADPRLEHAELAEVARELLGALPRPSGSTLTSALELSRERVTVRTHAGFHAGWIATRLAGRVLVTASERSLEVARAARRLADFDLGAAVTSAVADLGRLATASAPRPGRVALILRADAMLHGGGFGVWSVFADHASAEVERQGLTRYRVGTPIVEGAPQVAEPLGIASDGAMSFGLLSAPVSDEGAAVRRFTLIDKGVAVGLGLSLREAARRKNAQPNGGVRNLDVTPGTWPGGDTGVGALAARRTLDVRRLRSLSIDPHTADATLDVALALEREGTTERAVTGGMVRLDLVAALARARRSATPILRGAYHGPDAVVIDDVELLA